MFLIHQIETGLEVHCVFMTMGQDFLTKAKISSFVKMTARYSRNAVFMLQINIAIICTCTQLIGQCNALLDDNALRSEKSWAQTWFNFFCHATLVCVVF